VYKRIIGTNTDKKIETGETGWWIYPSLQFNHILSCWISKSSLPIYPDK